MPAFRQALANPTCEMIETASQEGLGPNKVIELLARELRHTFVIELAVGELGDARRNWFANGMTRFCR